MKNVDILDRLPLSMIKQYSYCKRRFSLMFIDGEWEGNFKIVQGDITHSKVDDPFFNEKRGNIHNSRSVPVYSDELNVYGIADIVEFIQDNQGIHLDGKQGLWKINPIEYKNGKPEKSKADIYQLATIAMCLEEMFGCTISRGDLYYNKIRRRITVDITDELRNEVADRFSIIHNAIRNNTMFPKDSNQNCELCSLLNICMPLVIEKEISTKAVIKRFID